MKPVSAETDRRLREALARLVGGASVTGGRPSIANLAREAGVSRATANRAAAVVAELRAAVSLRKKAAAPTTDERGEQSRRADENILAQHIQVRALLRGEVHRRATNIDNVVPIVRR